MTLGKHTLRSYDEQLNHLLSLTMDMGKEVQDLIIDAKKSFREINEDKIADAKLADKHINKLDKQIEEEAITVLALQSPMAIDLRFVISIIKITGMLEHAGDLAKNTIKRSMRIAGLVPEDAIVKLEEMSDIIVEMLTGALSAFADNDVEKSAIIWKMDKDIDAIYKSIIDMMQEEMGKSADRVMPCTQVVFAAKNLERLGDHITNLTKMVYYVMAGKRPNKATLKSIIDGVNASSDKSDNADS
ncbi:MAG: phosphate signaling complex protein PhoU [Rickettsiales bacterium]